jgi:hypothetical protein
MRMQQRISDAKHGLQMRPCDLGLADQTWAVWNSTPLELVGRVASEGPAGTWASASRPASAVTLASYKGAKLRSLIQPPTPKAATAPAISLYCISIMFPWGLELRLLKAQLVLRTSIFACDEAAVYSNTSIDLSRGVSTQTFDAALLPSTAGASGMNAVVFVKFWERVLGLGHWAQYNFTVKVDPDAVFIPSRLRSFVSSADRKKANQGNGIFFKTCAFGDQPSIEIISSRALSVFSLESDLCATPSQEGNYLQRCLHDLHVVQIDKFGILAAEQCKSQDWEACLGAHVAFHPFRSVRAYTRCLFAGSGMSKQSTLAVN